MSELFAAWLRGWVKWVWSTIIDSTPSQHAEGEGGSAVGRRLPETLLLYGSQGRSCDCHMSMCVKHDSHVILYPEHVIFIRCVNVYGTLL